MSVVSDEALLVFSLFSYQRLTRVGRRDDELTDWLRPFGCSHEQNTTHPKEKQLLETSHHCAIEFASGPQTMSLKNAYINLLLDARRNGKLIANNQSFLLQWPTLGPSPLFAQHWLPHASRKQAMYHFVTTSSR